MNRHLPFLCLVGMLPLAGCGGGTAQKEPPHPNPDFTIKGDDRLLQVAAAWAERYNADQAAVKVSVEGGGSGSGIAGLIGGKVGVAATVRTLSDAERNRCIAAWKKEPIGALIGYEAVAVCVHRDNPISSLTLEDLLEMYAHDGRLRAWQELGWSEGGEVRALSGGGSLWDGTLFRGAVFGSGLREPGRVSEFGGTAEVVEWCAGNRPAIGFAGFGYAATKAVRWLPIAWKRGDPAVEPSEDSIRSGSYPLARPLYLFTLDPPSPEIAGFLAFAQGPTGQQLLREHGFISVSERPQ